VSTIVGVDVGGTFTDAILVDLATGELRRAKVPTTVEDQSEGVLATFPELGLEPEELSLFCHGTTAGINAFLERRGAHMGLICTEGTRDLLEMGRLERDSRNGLYDPTWKRPQQERPIVERRFIREVPGRIRYDGSTHIELDEAAVRRELEFLRDEGVESVGVCLINSYANLAHEQRVVEMVREILPDAYVQSSAFRPVIGEYARTVGVVIDAYTGPVVARYLNRLRDSLQRDGYEGAAVIMQVNGGVRTLQRTAESFPAYTLESGPVAGMLGVEYYGRNFLGLENLVCVDIGGTSTDVGIVVDGIAQAVDDWEVEWTLPLGVPAIDVRSIGAGGGSLIQVDHMGTLRVGPESAGAQPGPVCYDRGGTEPTITDAHAVLGALRPETFLGGRMSLDLDAAHAAMSRLGERLGMDAHVLASEAVRLMNANIEATVTKLVFERGVDLRRFSLFSFGGAGSLHAAEVARAAGIGEVIVPEVAGGFSAMGLVTSPPKVDRAVSNVESLDAISLEDLSRVFDEIHADVIRDLVEQEVAEDEIEIERSIYGMYTGQSFSNELALDEWPLTAAGLERWRTRFDDMYERLYGYSAAESPVTITTLRIVATGARRDLQLPRLAAGDPAPPAQALDGRHQLHLSDGTSEQAPFYVRDRLLAGNRIEGPAVIEDPMTTILVPQGCVARIDEYGNVRITIGEGASA
jgi:N-methylhydantoinase A